MVNLVQDKVTIWLRHWPMCWAAICTRSVRWRISERTATTSPSGRNAALSNPTECRNCSH
jgi:hypothetical protein